MWPCPPQAHNLVSVKEKPKTFKKVNVQLEMVARDRLPGAWERDVRRGGVTAKTGSERDGSVLELSVMTAAQLSALYWKPLNCF